MEPSKQKWDILQLIRTNIILIKKVDPGPLAYLSLRNVASDLTG